MRKHLFNLNRNGNDFRFVSERICTVSAIKIRGYDKSTTPVFTDCTKVSDQVIYGYKEYTVR